MFGDFQQQLPQVEPVQHDPEVVVTLKELAQKALSDINNDNRITYKVEKCQVEWLPYDDIKRPMFSCKDCKKRTEDGLFIQKCLTCDKKVVIDYQPHFNFSLALRDGSDEEEFYLQCFGEVGDILLGVSAS